MNTSGKVRGPSASSKLLAPTAFVHTSSTPMHASAVAAKTTSML